MNDTLTKNKMNIYLLNIPFAMVGVAIAVVPLMVGIKHHHRGERDLAASSVPDVLEFAPAETQWETAA